MRGIRAPSSWKNRYLELEFNYTKDGKNLIACFVKPDQISFPGVFPSFRKNGKNRCPVPFEVQSAVIIGGRPGLNSEPQNFEGWNHSALSFKSIKIDGQSETHHPWPGLNPPYGSGLNTDTRHLFLTLIWLLPKPSIGILTVELMPLWE